jgi:hypothetical protein
VKTRLLIAAFLALAGSAAGQSLTQRGLLEGRAVAYPSEAPNDSVQLVADGLLRQEVFWRPAPWVTIAGAFDARADSHARVDRSWAVDWSDRGLLRPALSVRRLGVAVHRGGLTVEAGKQFIRWGKADVLNPTDRFAPRDLLEVVDNDFLGVTAVRLTYERGPDTVDLVWAPRFTPSRLPLSDQRWAIAWGPLLGVGSGLPPGTPIQVEDLGSRFPERSQFGARWGHVGEGFELSLSLFDGFSYYPRAEATRGPDPARVAVTRVYPTMRMYGGDAAWPLRWFTVKGEIGYFTTTDARTNDYGIYVVQVERQRGEWMFVGGYAGEFVTTRRTATGGAGEVFAEAFTRTFLGRASYTLDVNRTLAFEGAVRQNGQGAWLEAEYAQQVGRHWRATVRAHLLRGAPDDFIGQYRLNSSLQILARFSY